MPSSSGCCICSARQGGAWGRPPEACAGCYPEPRTRRCFSMHGRCPQAPHPSWCPFPRCPPPLPTTHSSTQAEFKSAASDFAKYGQEYDAARLREQVSRGGLAQLPPRWGGACPQRGCGLRSDVRLPARAPPAHHVTHMCCLLLCRPAGDGDAAGAEGDGLAPSQLQGHPAATTQGLSGRLTARCRAAAAGAARANAPPSCASPVPVGLSPVPAACSAYCPCLVLAQV